MPPDDRRRRTVSVEWHDVEDGLPSRGDIVLIHADLNQDVWTGYYNGINWCNMSHNVFRDGLVLHWAEMPNPPAPPLPDNSQEVEG